VRRADAIAYVGLPRDFGSSRSARFELGFDPARGMEAAYLERLLADALGAVRRGPGELALQRPIRIDKASVTRAGIAPRNASDIVFPSAVLWGLIGCAACFAVSLVAERTRGTYARLRALPLTRHTLLAGKAVSALAASLSVGLLLTLLATLVFGVQVESFFKLLVALLCTALCFVGITIALSVLGKSEQAVAGAGWATLLLMAMLGGGMVPLSLMPEWLTKVSHVSPVKWGILALEGGTWRSFSMTELMVPCAVLLGVGALSFLVGAMLFARSEA
jgi:ABC-2 type transport system permease protein